MRIAQWEECSDQLWMPGVGMGWGLIEVSIY